eukprot:SAG11_NODE_27941_length_327_cov_0.605263_1_plen_30_part_10
MSARCSADALAGSRRGTPGYEALVDAAWHC